jgi:hypothetical protein
MKAAPVIDSVQESFAEDVTMIAVDLRSNFSCWTAAVLSISGRRHLGKLLVGACP